MTESTEKRLSRIRVHVRRYQENEQEACGDAAFLLDLVEPQLKELEQQQAEIASLKATIEQVRDLHKPFAIWDECEHDHKDGDPGVRDIDEIGLTCEKMYDICRECCTDGDHEQGDQCAQSECCNDKHMHGPRTHICDTRAILDAPSKPEESHCLCGHTRVQHGAPMQHFIGGKALPKMRRCDYCACSDFATLYNHAPSRLEESP